MEREDLQRQSDSVRLRATKDGNSEVIVLSRAAAALRRSELEAEGWSVELSEIERQGTTDGSRAWSR